MLGTVDVANPKFCRQTIALAVEQQQRVIASGLKVAVVDAGPLFKVLALIYVREYDDNSVLTRTDLPHRPEVQDGYLRLFGANLEHFWLNAVHFLRTKNFDERLLSLLEMHGRNRSRHGMCILGPSDMGLIELAIAQGCVLLTGDERSLAPLAWKHSVDSRLVQSLVEGIL